MLGPRTDNIKLTQILPGDDPNRNLSEPQPTADDVRREGGGGRNGVGRMCMYVWL